jgi:uncharacterized coiled-coil protein SlyX
MDRARAASRRAEAVEAEGGDPQVHLVAFDRMGRAMRLALVLRRRFAREAQAEAVERVRDGDPDPACLACGGVLKSDTISFGQALVPEVIEAAMDAAEQCDLLIAAGSTLSVYPAANVVPRARATGARVVILNGEPTQMDRYADVVKPESGRYDHVSLTRRRNHVITGSIKSQVDAIWNAFWSGGISNPMEVIEQMTYLLFIKRLDELQTVKEKQANRLKREVERLTDRVANAEQSIGGDPGDEPPPPHW